MKEIRNSTVPIKLVITRAVKTGYPARIGPAHDGLELLRAGPGQKGPEDKRAQKYLPKPGPLRATGFRASPVTLRF